jgi:hypothetical protein
MQAAGQSTSKVEEKDEPASNEEEENWKNWKIFILSSNFTRDFFQGRRPVSISHSPTRSCPQWIQNSKFLIFKLELQLVHLNYLWQSLWRRKIFCLARLMSGQKIKYFYNQFGHINTLY